MAARVSDAGLRATGLLTPTNAGAADHACDRGRAVVGEIACQTAPDAVEGAVVPLLASTPTLDRLGTAAPVIRSTLRHAAQALLDAWDRVPKPEAADALVGPIAALRAHLAPAPAPPAGGRTRRAREGTKQHQVLALLERQEGVSGPDIGVATGWASHTVRGFLAGLKNKGIPVEILERVRQGGPNKEGTKGSYTIYQIIRADG